MTSQEGRSTAQLSVYASVPLSHESIFLLMRRHLHKSWRGQLRCRCGGKMQRRASQNVSHRGRCWRMLLRQLHHRPRGWLPVVRRKEGKERLRGGLFSAPTPAAGRVEAVEEPGGPQHPVQIDDTDSTSGTSQAPGNIQNPNCAGRPRRTWH